jgi:nicotinate-nucleotide pyrophosphorylase (carboxylating)
VQKFLDLQRRFLQSLAEDGAFADLTTRAIGGPRKTVSGRLVCKAEGVFCGASVIQPLLRRLDRRARVRLLAKDGSAVRKGSTLARLRASESAILAAERVILNLVCRLSGIATLTRRYVNAVAGTPAVILDTRKTTPLWRDLERLPVRAGGGSNHRFSLADAVLVKDNHWRLLDARGQSVAAVYGLEAPVRRTAAFVAIEAANRRQVWEAIKARADIILLDNMPENRIKEAVVMIRAARKAFGTSAPLIEVSGGITPEIAGRLSRLGVDRISVGALTHSAPALDISLEVD